MAEKALLIDTSLCMGCRGCQVACKQWWQLEADVTTQTGSYQNPPDLTWKSWSVVRFVEGTRNGNTAWFFAKDQCRHCPDPMPCSLGCPNGAITKNEFGGVLIDQSKCGNCEVGCVDYCPFGVPKREIGPEGQEYCRVFKCRMCYDRIEGGKAPACASTCPTGAISFGDKADIVALAEARVAELKGAGEAGAEVYPNTDGNAMWVLLAPNDSYELAEYQEHVPPAQPQVEEPKQRTRLAGRGLGSTIGAAVLVGGVALAGLKALSDRKDMLAAREDEE